MIDRIKNFFTNLFGGRKREYVAAAEKARYGDLRNTGGSADRELRAGLRALRNKSRWLARNSSSMKRYMWLMVINIVGDKGFVFKSRVRKLDGDPDTTLNERVEKAWAKWCEQPTVDGVMTIVDLETQMVRSWCTDGEVIWELVDNPKYRDGFAVNPIESDYLDETLNGINRSTGNEIRMGVEIDIYGAPVAYHFLTYHPGASDFRFVDYNKSHRRVEASRVIHMYERLRPGQTRGEPPTSTVVNSVKMLDGYREAETVGRRLRSALMGFFKRALPGSSGIDGLGDRETDDDESLIEMDVQPGLMKELPPGVDFDKFDPGGSQTDYADFEGQIKKDIAMGFNISAYSHGMETKGVSYSSGRTVVIEDRDFYKVEQGFFSRQGLKRLFNRWLSRHLLQDDCLIPPSRASVIREKAEFKGRGWDWVDPAKDIKANSEALATHQTSLTQIAASRGRDIADLLDEIAEERQMAEKRGLKLDYSTVNTVLSDSNSKDPEEDGNDEEDD
jgi:lambda family phage portal protein